MPRPLRLNLAGVPQHVTQRGNNRQACFFRASDYRLYLGLLQIACQKHDCQLHAFVLMTNHVHLLLTPSTPDGVSLLIRDLGRDYVRSINKAYCRTGTMWEGRFKSSLVDEEAYCLACYRYIEMNPVRARMVEHPSDYAWSSHQFNALGKPVDFLTPHAAWLALGGTDEDRQHAYRNLFKHPLEELQIESLRYGLRKCLPTGSDRFKRQIEQALSVTLGDGKIGRPRK